MSYRIACNEPDFMQSVPPGSWTRVPDNSFPGQYRYRNNDTGATVLVPAVWYNGTARERASHLRFCARRADDSAASHAADDKPWSPHEAGKARKQSENLRRLADHYEAHGDAIAGHVQAQEL